MPYPVIITLKVIPGSGLAFEVQKEFVLPIPPFVGMIVNNFQHDWDSQGMITSVEVDLQTGEVVCFMDDDDCRGLMDRDSIPYTRTLLVDTPGRDYYGWRVIESFSSQSFSATGNRAGTTTDGE
jgi:hypothetical protein